MLNATVLSKIEKYLCPPGNGVLTINTGQHHKKTIQNYLYPNSKDITKSWLSSITDNKKHKTLMLGVCSDTGGGILKSASWGPLHIRNTLIKKYSENKNYLDIGDVKVIPHFHHDKYLNQDTIHKCRTALYGANIQLPISSHSIAEDVLSELYTCDSNFKILTLGGDHSVSYPTTKTYLKAKARQGKKVSIIHFDAHTDLLESRFGVDITFGSWCSHILKYLPSPNHLIQLGIRSSGKNKKHWESTVGVKQFWAQDIKKEGTSAISDQILHFLKQNNVDELYITFDIDALDEKFASATGTPEPNGLSPCEVIDIIRKLADFFPVTGADIMEVAPFLKTESDIDGTGMERTLSNAADIANLLLKCLS